MTWDEERTMTEEDSQTLMDSLACPECFLAVDVPGEWSCPKCGSEWFVVLTEPGNGR